jgi:hypothetical protein
MSAVAVQLPFTPVEERDWVTIVGAVALDDGGAAIAGMRSIEGEKEFRCETFITRFDNAFALVEHAIVGDRAAVPAGLFVRDGRVLLTTRENRIIDGKKTEQRGVYLRSGPWSAVRLTDGFSISGSCGSNDGGAFAIARGDELDVVVLLNQKYDDAKTFEHAELRGDLGKHLIDDDTEYERPSAFWMRGLHDLDGKRALLTILDGYGRKGDAHHRLVVDDKGRVSARLDLRGEHPYEKAQLNSAVDVDKKRIVIKTAKSVHVFDYGGALIERVPVPNGFGSARALGWANGFVVANEAGHVVVRVDDVDATSLADAVKAMRSAGKAKKKA